MGHVVEQDNEQKFKDAEILTNLMSKCSIVLFGTL